MQQGMSSCPRESVDTASALVVISDDVLAAVVVTASAAAASAGFRTASMRLPHGSTGVPEVYRFWGFGFWANWGSQLGPQMCLNGTPLK